MQQDLKRDGLALSVFFIMLKLLTDTLPPPEPVVPLPTVEGLLAPKEKERISQAFLALKSLSVVSPSAGTAPPVTYMNESNAMTQPPQRKTEPDDSHRRDDPAASSCRRSRAPGRPVPLGREIAAGVSRPGVGNLSGRGAAASG